MLKSSPRAVGKFATNRQEGATRRWLPDPTGMARPAIHLKVADALSVATPPPDAWDSTLGYTISGRRCAKIVGVVCVAPRKWTLTMQH